jgi:hypothetical protein
MSSDTINGGAGLKFRLSVMMFLQFFIWGAWYPLVFDYVPSLGFSNWQKLVILNAFHVSALIALFFSNQFADRNFAAQKFLAFSQLIGGLAILGLAYVKTGWATTIGDTQINLTFWAFFALIGVHTLFYVPTISITNSIAFANLKDSRDFGFVRLWGTIGWIAAAWPFVFILVDWVNVPSINSETMTWLPGNPSVGKVDAFSWLKAALGTPKTGPAFREATPYTFMAAGIASLVLAAFSMALPNTPPKPAGQATERFAWLEAMKLLRHGFVLILFIVTFLDSAIHQSFFYWSATFLKSGVKLPGNWIMPVMSIGQVAEIATMAFLGYVLKKLGWRFTMVIGILGHAGRFAVFAFAQDLPQEWQQQAAAIAVNILHGICYAFFFATVYIFIEEYFPKDARASAQGLFNMLILGVGPMVSNYFSGELRERFATARDASGSVTAVDFQKIFMVPLVTALAAALLLLLFFHPPAKKPEG